MESKPIQTVVKLCVLLSLLMASSLVPSASNTAAFPAKGQAPASTEAAPSLSAPNRPLADMLNPDGTLNLAGGFSGSLDPAGWTMQTGRDGKPVFVPASASSSAASPATRQASKTPQAPLAPGDEKWDTTTSTWSALGSGTVGVNNTVNALAVIGSDLYVGGRFTTAGGVQVNFIAKWDTTTSTWSALGSGTVGVDNPVRTLAVMGTALYVGGDFSLAGGVQVNRIAMWDTTTSTWSALGSGTAGADNTVNALAVIGSDLYVGGAFITAGGVQVNFIAKWDTTTSTWSALGSGTVGLSTHVNALAVMGTALYVGGIFTLAGGVQVNYIAKWDTTTSTWSALGSGTVGVDNHVFRLAVIGSDLYVGGRFTAAGGVQVNYIAKWDTTTSAWSALGSGEGVNNEVNALAVTGTALYVGGWFITAGGVQVNRIAMWDTTTSTWSALGSGEGVDNTVNALTVMGSDLYVGGSFFTAGGVQVNRIARYSAIQWQSNLGAPGAALAAPSIYFTTTGGVTTTQVFVGGTSGVEAAFQGNGSPLWNANIGSAIQSRSPIIRVNGTNMVFITSGDGYVTALRAHDGSPVWSTQIGESVVAGVAYQPAVPVVVTGTTDVIFAGTYNDNPALTGAEGTLLTNSRLVALNARTGDLVWSFETFESITLGIIPTTPAVDWATNTVYFGTKSAPGGPTGNGGIGGVWAVDTTTGLARWGNHSFTLGDVVNSAPTLSRDGQTLYIGTVSSNVTTKPGTERVEGSGTWTLHALNSMTGASRASYTIPDPLAADAGDFRGSVWVWPNSANPANTDLYAVAGDRVYAFTDTGAPGTLPFKAGWPASGYVSVPGPGTPVYLPATNSVYTGGNNGTLYRIDAANGTIASSLYLTTNGAASDLTYDVTRNVFYVTVDNLLKAVVRDW